MWESEGEALSEDKSVCLSDSRDSNLCNEALHVVGLYGLGDKISLFFKDWELAKVASSCRMAHAVPGNAGLVGRCYQEACHGMKCLLSPWTGCDS